MALYEQVLVSRLGISVAKENEAKLLSVNEVNS